MLRCLLLFVTLMPVIIPVLGCVRGVSVEEKKLGDERSATYQDRTRSLPGAGPAAANELKDSLGLELVLIPAGEFRMGNEESVEALRKAFPYVLEERFEDAKPSRRVRITKPFFLAKYETTVGQFRRFVESTGYRTEAETNRLGGVGFDQSIKDFSQKPEYGWRNPGFAQTDSHPVTNVSWNDAMAFCDWLSKKEGAEYRLPTEAEWEYACRGGTQTRYHHGDDPEGLAQVGNFADRTAQEGFDCADTIAARDGYVFTAPVGRFRSNPFGLYDMHGNVHEWCSDRYDSNYYRAEPANDPAGPSEGWGRVYRGGCWNSEAGYSRSANRYWGTPMNRVADQGFRVARDPGSR